jgi:hypothetical protein
MMVQPKVRIVSDGLHMNTRVFVDDVELTNVVSVAWTAKPNEFAEASLILEEVAVDLVGELASD